MDTPGSRAARRSVVSADTNAHRRPDREKAPNRRQRTRLAPEERERMILDAAMAFFAERGFGADTRQLASQLGVSQSLIYRYFGSKDNLLERVYEETFVSRWKADWEPLLKDRSISLEERLRRFYIDYFRVVDDPIWIRIAMRSSLAGHRLTKRYVESLINRLLEIITEEARLIAGPDMADHLEGQGLELAWHLHSTLIYYLIRKHIHRVPVSDDIEGLVETMVQNFLNGLGRDPKSTGV